MDNLVSIYYYTAGVLFCMCTSQTVNPLPQIAAVVIVVVKVVEIVVVIEEVIVEVIVVVIVVV